MRRPHPRFDSARNAWVTRAGGRLKILARGPKNAQTEAAAWDAFYAYMADLGNPVPASTVPHITLGRLADEFDAWLRREVEAGRKSAGTLAYYRHYLQRFLDAVGGHRAASGVRPIELETYKTTWHSVQSVQRMYNWAVRMGHLRENPVRAVEAPDLGQRERILTPVETARLLRAADPDHRAILLALRQTIARPQEVRAVQWKHLVVEPYPLFELRDFKSRKRRRDRRTARRRIPIDDRLFRLLLRLARRRSPAPDDYVFLNSKGRPWTAGALRLRMARLRERIGLGADPNGERVVNYTFRHTAATRASASGIRDRVLADLMGHTRTETTQRYLHLQDGHLHEAIRRANTRPMASTGRTGLAPVAAGNVAPAGARVASAARFEGAGGKPPSPLGRSGKPAGDRAGLG